MKDLRNFLERHRIGSPPAQSRGWHKGTTHFGDSHMQALASHFSVTVPPDFADLLEKHNEPLSSTLLANRPDCPRFVSTPAGCAVTS
jgi:hypothetical protein